jgi:Helix-turn-helix domain
MATRVTRSIGETRHSRVGKTRPSADPAPILIRLPPIGVPFGDTRRLPRRNSSLIELSLARLCEWESLSFRPHGSIREMAALVANYIRGYRNVFPERGSDLTDWIGRSNGHFRIFFPTIPCTNNQCLAYSTIGHDRNELDFCVTIYNYMVVDSLSKAFSALSDPTRRAILARLARGPATVNAIAEPFRLSQQAISKHLAYLLSLA